MLMTIEYRKGSLFDAPVDDTILLHACNAQGRWGSGIAAEFARRFPSGYREYSAMCYRFLKPGERSPLVGQFMAVVDSRNLIGCAITSNDYGPRVDPVTSIVQATEHALNDAVAYADKTRRVIHSPKINAGLFRVPWDQTAKVIQSALDKHPQVRWVVWEP